MVFIKYNYFKMYVNNLKLLLHRFLVLNRHTYFVLKERMVLERSKNENERFKMKISNCTIILNLISESNFKLLHSEKDSA